MSAGAPSISLGNVRGTLRSVPRGGRNMGGIMPKMRQRVGGAARSMKAGVPRYGKAVGLGLMGGTALAAAAPWLISKMQKSSAVRSMAKAAGLVKKADNGGVMFTYDLSNFANPPAWTDIDVEDPVALNRYRRARKMQPMHQSAGTMGAIGGGALGMGLGGLVGSAIGTQKGRYGAMPNGRNALIGALLGTGLLGYGGSKLMRGLSDRAQRKEDEKIEDEAKARKDDRKKYSK